jgi:hypothetical protein
VPADLTRLINASLSDGETDEDTGEPVAINGGLVERFVSPWKIAVVLRNGTSNTITALYSLATSTSLFDT